MKNTTLLCLYLLCLLATAVDASAFVTHGPCATSSSTLLSSSSSSSRRVRGVGRDSSSTTSSNTCLYAVAKKAKKAGTAKRKVAATKKKTAVVRPTTTTTTTTDESFRKADFVDSIHQQTGMSKTDSEVALQAVLNTITTQVSKGKRVSLVGFGTFKLSYRSARKGRNPQTGEEIDIAASNAPTFSASKAFKEKCNP